MPASLKQVFNHLAIVLPDIGIYFDKNKEVFWLVEDM